ncbi:hypothetical protein [Aeromonas sp. s7(2024)]|uniref:hypothetical protein n=1 Tax=Aeromonas sp. s7(2024) TaxID=3138491 RepID=UPI0034A25ABF
MTNQEIAKLIQRKYLYTKPLTEQETLTILIKVNAKVTISGTISEKELDLIVSEVLHGKEQFIFESVEMSSSTSILQQIIIAAKKQANHETK